MPKLQTWQWLALAGIGAFLWVKFRKHDDRGTKDPEPPPLLKRADGGTIPPNLLDWTKSGGVVGPIQNLGMFRPMSLKDGRIPV